MKNIFYLFFFTLITQTISFSAQTKKEPKYSKPELISFLKVYKYTLDNPFDPLVSLQNNYKKSNLSEERLSEILQAQFADKPISISDDEKKEMQKLKELVETDKKNYDEKLNQYISENNLTPEKYFEIKKLYNENQSFQKKILKIIKS